MGTRSRPVRRSWRPAALIALAITLASAASADLAAPPKPLTRPNPDYPLAALSRGIAGSVLLEYTVDGRGRVVKARVLESTPPGVFEEVALRAVSRWRYEALGTEPTTMQVRLRFRR